MSIRVAVLLIVATTTAGLAGPLSDSDARWVAKATHKVNAVAAGVAFSIELPVGLVEAFANNKEVREWRVDEDYYGNPHFAVSVGDDFPKSLEDAKRLELHDKDIVFTRRELTADRYVLVYQTKTFVQAEVYLKAGKRVLLCEGGRSEAGGMTDQDTFGPFFAKVCSTMKLR